MPHKTTPNQNPNLLDLFRGVLDDHLGKAEFLKAFEKVVQYVQSVDKRLTDTVSKLATALTRESQQRRDEFDSLTSTLKSQVNDLFVGQRMSAMEKAHGEALARLDTRVASVKDGAPGQRGERGLQGRSGRDGSPDTADVIRKKLESLDGDNRLDVSAIKGLDKFVKKSIPPFTGGIVGRDLIKDVDISSQLDGSTTTFNIQGVWNVVSVHLSSFPHALRKGTDFTWTPTSITFTSQIDPATSLAAGQTCVLTVVSA